jgi:molybdopterin converting factor small subunit
MKVRVLFFSVLQDISGCGELEHQVKPGSTIGDLVEELARRWPDLAKWRLSLLLAIDQAYVKPDAPLKDGCEVALMPPVQGG